MLLLLLSLVCILHVIARSSTDLSDPVNSHLNDHNRELLGQVSQKGAGKGALKSQRIGVGSLQGRGTTRKQLPPFLKGKSSAYIDLYYKFFTNVTKVDAVPAAIQFLLDQEEKGALMSTEFMKTQALRHMNYHAADSKDKNTIRDSNSALLPLCHVTYDAVIDDSHFEFLGKNAKPLYDYNSCPFVYPSYFVPPVCLQQEEDANIISVNKWKWMLGAAREGKCRMPPTTPLDAGVEYLKQKREKYRGTDREVRPVKSTARFNKDKPGKSVNILWLGLSFLGQQYLSSVCQNYDTRGDGPSLVQGEAMIGYKNNAKSKHVYKRKISVDPMDRCVPDNRIDIVPMLEETRKNTGDKYNYPSMYCTPHFVEYSKMIGGEEITVRYCYSYVYNLAKNFRLHPTLPCEFDWSEIDVIFGIVSHDEFSSHYIRATGGLKHDLSHVSYISVQGIINHVPQALNAAYAAHNFSKLMLPNIRGKPKSCLDQESGESLKQQGVIQQYLNLCSADNLGAVCLHTFEQIHISECLGHQIILLK